MVKTSEIQVACNSLDKRNFARVLSRISLEISAMIAAVG